MADHTRFGTFSETIALESAGFSVLRSSLLALLSFRWWLADCFGVQCGGSIVAAYFILTSVDVTSTSASTFWLPILPHIFVSAMVIVLDWVRSCSSNGPFQQLTIVVWWLQIYFPIAEGLTRLENHRHQSRFDRHLVAKLAVFSFTNSFFSLYYLAFSVQSYSQLRYQLSTLVIMKCASHILSRWVFRYVSLIIQLGVCSCMILILSCSASKRIWVSLWSPRSPAQTSATAAAVTEEARLLRATQLHRDYSELSTRP